MARPRKDPRDLFSHDLRAKVPASIADAVKDAAAARATSETEIVRGAVMEWLEREGYLARPHTTPRTIRAAEERARYSADPDTPES